MAEWGIRESKMMFALLVTGAMLGGVVVADSFTVSGRRGPNREAIIDFTGDTNAYFQIHQASAVTGSFSVVDMELGLTGTHSWTNPAFLTNSNQTLLYKVRKVAQTNSLDEDEDGMPDVYELGWSFIDPLDASDAQQDQDGDALFNLGEYQYGADPTDRDTDKDWVLDGYEVVQGTDPTNPASAPVLEFRVDSNAFYVTDTNLQVDFGPHVADEVVIAETPDMANSVTAALTGIISYSLTDAGNGWRPLYARLRRTSDSAESELIEQMFVLDAVAPQITGVLPTNGTVTTLERVQVKGFVLDDVGPVRVLVNGEWANGVITSYFHRGEVYLTNGLNTIEIIARDAAGNAATQMISVSRTTSGSNAPPTIAGNTFPQTYWDGIYSNWYSSLAYFNSIPQWDTVDGWWLYRDHWVAASNQLKEVVKQSVKTCTYVPSPNCTTDNSTDTTYSPQSTPITYAAFGEEAVWLNKTSTFLDEPEWNRETFTYRDVLTFMPSNQSENVIIKFIGMGYRRVPGEPGYANLITFRGSTGFIYQAQVAFNATIQPGVELRISASDFTWPDHSYIGTRYDRRLVYDARTKTKARLLWFDGVEFVPQ